MAIVSVPAYAESFALSLVAEEHMEVDNSDEEVNKGVETMESKAEMIVEEQAIAEETIVEETVAEEAFASETEKPEAEVTEAEVATVEEIVAEEVPAVEAVAETDNDEDEPETEEEKPEDEKEAVAEEETAVAQNEADWAEMHAKLMALEAEVQKLNAMKAAADAEIERLRAVEAELYAIQAAKEAEELAYKQDQARIFAQKQGLDIKLDEVASAIASLDYTKIAELTMAQESFTAEPEVTVASYAAFEPMKINNRFENVLKRGSN